MEPIGSKWLHNHGLNSNKGCVVKFYKKPDLLKSTVPTQKKNLTTHPELNT